MITSTDHPASGPPPSGARLRAAALALVLSLVLVPVCAYVGGSVVVGEYEGQNRLLGFLIAIFGDAFRGRWMAWVLILAPAMTVGIWALVIRIIRHADASASSAE